MALLCTGATGIGITGATGTSETIYGYIYNVSGQSVAIEADVIFDSNGLMSGVTHAHTYASSSSCTLSTLSTLSSIVGLQTFAGGTQINVNASLSVQRVSN